MASTSEQDEKDRKQLRPAVTPGEARAVCLSIWKQAMRVGDEKEVEVVELDGYDLLISPQRLSASSSNATMASRASGTPRRSMRRTSC